LPVFVLNYAEDVRSKLKGGLTQINNSPETAQHNRGIKRKIILSHKQEKDTEKARIAFAFAFEFVAAGLAQSSQTGPVA
jgi:hypothetical protein